MEPEKPLTSAPTALVETLESEPHATATTEVEAAAAKTLSVHHKRAAAASKRQSEPSGTLQEGVHLPNTLQGGGNPPAASVQQGVFSRSDLVAHTPSEGFCPEAFPTSSLEGFAEGERGRGRPPGLLARLRRGSVCSLASLAAPSVAAGNTSSGREDGGRFEVYVHSILDLEEKELGQGPMQIRIAPAQQLQLQQQQQQYMKPLLQQCAEADMHTAAAKALLAVKSGSSSVAPAVASQGLLFLAVRSRIVCSLSAQGREVFVGLVRKGPWDPTTDTLVGYACINVSDERLLSMQQWLLRSPETPAVGAVLLKRA
ncbi:hypothetical protein Esti_006015 [Eimeria stiedai]